MFNISGFLEKFLKLEAGNQVKLEIILQTIKTKTGIDLKKENFEIKGERIILKVNSVIRNEIFMYKKNIEEDLNNQKIFLKIS